MKKCPYCAEEIQDEAIKCKHCGESVGATDFETRTVNVCPKCEKIFPTSYITCDRHILTNLVSKQIQVPLEEINVCPKCNKTYNNTWKVCVSCEGNILLVKRKAPKEASGAGVKGGISLTCPRCNFQGSVDAFKDAYSDSTCCCLACIMILPAVLYYFFRNGKKRCPQCSAIF